MKKILLSLAVALLISIVTVSASAAGELDSTEASEQEAMAINSSILKTMQLIDLSELDYDTQVQIFRDAYLAAGWTEVNGDKMSRESNIAPETLELAYMDIDKADGELREKILAAREEVIYNHSWVNDKIEGVMMGSVDSKNRQFSITPKFSDLFPGWDVPKCEVIDAPVTVESAEEVPAPEKAADDAKATALSAARKTMDILYNKDTWIYKANSTSAAHPFLTALTKEGCINFIHTVPTAFKTAGLTSVNIGYNNSAGENIGYELRVPENEDVYCVFSSSAQKKFSVRASTYTNEGTASMLVSRET